MLEKSNAEEKVYDVNYKLIKKGNLLIKSKNKSLAKGTVINNILSDNDLDLDNEHMICKITKIKER